MKRLVLQCEAESADLQLLDTLGSADFSVTPSLGFESSPVNVIYWFNPQECFGPIVVFELLDDNNTTKFGKTVQQYALNTGSLQIVTVWTTLSNHEFSRVTIDGVETMQSNDGSIKGPLYVGSLVIYGIPHYLASIGSNRHYSGRDIVNEFGWKDSLGFVLSVGLSEPRDTFGVVFSYEFARGISVSLSP